MAYDELEGWRLEVVYLNRIGDICEKDRLMEIELIRDLEINRN